MAAVCIPGNPIPKGRPRFGKGRGFTPKRTRDYERHVKALAQAQFGEPVAGPVHVRMAFYRDSRQRCDLDNLCKCLTDALNGIAYVDDCQIVSMEAFKGVDREHPRAVIEIEEVE